MDAAARARAATRIWLRDAALAERLDGVLFIGLKDWYPPIYDCGACGYATCAEFTEATRQRRDDSETFEFKGPQCNLRDIDLGIAVGSAAKAASLYNIDTAARPASPSPPASSASFRRKSRSPCR